MKFITIYNVVIITMSINEYYLHLKVENMKLYYIPAYELKNLLVFKTLVLHRFNYIYGKLRKLKT